MLSLYQALPAKDIKQTSSVIRHRTIKRLCPHILALGCVVLAEVAVECAWLIGELGADVASYNGDASHCDEDWKDPAYC
jgi:hypothetical protein